MNYMLRIVADGQTQEFTLASGETRIGARRGLGIQLKQEGIADEHALLMVEDEGVWIQDLDSTSGTYVNGEPVKESVWLQDGDEIHFGPHVSAVFEGSATSKSPASPSSSGVVQSEASVEAMPPKPRTKPKRRRSCFGMLLIGGLAVVVLAVAGYFLLTSGAINQRELLNRLGMGTGEISVVNTTETDLSTTLTQMEGTESGTPEILDTMQAAALEIKVFAEIQPGRYELAFSSADHDALNQTCRLQIKSGEVYQFVLIPEGIAVTEEGYEPAGPNEVNTQTSPLCNR